MYFNLYFLQLLQLMLCLQLLEVFWALSFASLGYISSNSVSFQNNDSWLCLCSLVFCAKIADFSRTGFFVCGKFCPVFFSHFPLFSSKNHTQKHSQHSDVSHF